MSNRQGRGLRLCVSAPSLAGPSGGEQAGVLRVGRTRLQERAPATTVRVSCGLWYLPHPDQTRRGLMGRLREITAGRVARSGEVMNTAASSMVMMQTDVEMYQLHSGPTQSQQQLGGERRGWRGIACSREARGDQVSLTLRSRT